MLKITGAAGVAGLAGCLGGDDDMEEIGIAHTGEGTISGGAAVTIQRLVREHSDNVRYNPQSSGGSPASLRMIADEQVEGNSGDGAAWLTAYNDAGPFSDEPIEPKSKLPSMCFSTAAVEFTWLARQELGLETTDDLLDDDITVYLHPPEWSTHPVFMQMYDRVEVDGRTITEHFEDRYLPLDIGDAPGALEEERIDAMIGLSASRRGLPSYSQDMDARTDLNRLEVTEPFEEAVRQEPAYVWEGRIDTYGWDIPEDTMDLWFMPDFTWMHDEMVSNEAVYEIADIVHENGEEFADSLGTNFDTSNAENMANYIDAAPVHPGAEEWMRDNGVWDDDTMVSHDEWEW